MPFALALFQAGSESSQDQTLYIILGVITLATLIALGLRFLVNMRDVLIAPSASLGHLGQTDNFFFSIFVVFLGGLIGLFGMLPRKMELISAFNEYASTVAHDIAVSNQNAIYRASSEQWGTDVMQSNFDTFGMGNLIFFPIVMVIIWLIVGSICFLGAKILGTGSSYSNFLSSLAYGSFFASIGLGFLSVIGVQGIAMTATKLPPTIEVFGIIGIVLMLYALVLFLMGISQAGDLLTGQVIFVIIILLIVLGGIGFLIFHLSTEPWDTFKTAIRSYNPAQGQY